MKRKSQRPTVLPLIAVCIALVDCSGSTTTSTTVFPTAIAVRQYTPAGALDTANFGAGKGVVITDFEPALNDYALANKLQADGKILVAGSAGKTLANGTPQAQVAVLRYNADGTLDSGFGTGGAARTPLGASNAEAVAIDIQADLKIVVAATILSASFSSQGIALLRYSGADGSLDTSFGGTGIVTQAINGATGSDTAAAAVLVQPADQKIVVAGHAQMVSGQTNIVLLRYNPDGTLDSTFGTNGLVTTTSLFTGDSVALAMLLQPADNKLVVAGSLGGGASPLDTVLLRYNANGSLDTTGFNAPNGFVTTNAGGDDFANSIALQSDNKLVVAGHANVNLMADTSDFAVLRYTSAGVLDTTFGANQPQPGVVITDLGAFDNAFSVALQNDGKIVVSGNTGNAGGNVSVAVARYTTAGGLDMGFGTNGFVTSAPMGPSFITSGNSAVLQPTTGSIIVAGYD